MNLIKLLSCASISDIGTPVPISEILAQDKSLMKFIHDTGTGHRLMRQTAGCTKQTIALLNNGGQGIYATSRLKHGPLVPHARYWHCYDRSPRAFGPRASVITMPISGMWHSGPCFNLYLHHRHIHVYACSV